MINSTLLPSYRGQTVRIVGKVQKVTGNTLLLQSSDMGNVEIALTPESTDLSQAVYVEVTGKVAETAAGEDQIREFTTVNIGDNVGKSPRTHPNLILASARACANNVFRQLTDTVPNPRPLFIRRCTPFALTAALRSQICSS